MLVFLSEEEIKEYHMLCKVRYTWKNVSEIEKHHIILDTLGYIDLDDFIQTNEKQLVETAYSHGLFFKNSIYFETRDKKILDLLLKAINQLELHEINQMILSIEKIDDEDDFLAKYVYDLHDIHLSIDHNENHWCAGSAYDIIHVNEVKYLILEYASHGNQQKFLNEFLINHHVTDIDQLNKEEKEYLISYLCPIIY